MTIAKMELALKENIALIAAIGTLAGAAIAASITKILEIVLEKRKQNYALQKEYLISKIKVAEKATVQLLQLSSALVSLGSVLINLENTGQIVEEYNTKMLELVNNVMVQVFQSHEAMAIHTYFDLTTQIKDSFSFSRIIQDKLNRLQLLHNEALELQINNSLGHQDLGVELEIKLNEVREMTHHLKTLCDEMSTMCLQVINDIRSDLRKH